MSKKNSSRPGPDYFISGPDDIIFHLAENPASAPEEPSAEQVAAMRRAIFGEGYLDVPARAERARQLLAEAERKKDRSPVDVGAIALTHELVRECMQQLSDRERVVWLLRYQNDMTIKEIADLLSLQEGAVKQSLFRLRKTIAQVIAQSNKVT